MKKITIVIFMVIFGVLNAQNANDCTDAIVLCGDTPVGIQPSGVGFDEFSLPGNNPPPCYSFNNQTAWFKVEIDQGGSFTFDITNDDLDEPDTEMFIIYLTGNTESDLTLGENETYTITITDIGARILTI